MTHWNLSGDRAIKLREFFVKCLVDHPSENLKKAYERHPDFNFTSNYEFLFHFTCMDYLHFWEVIIDEVCKLHDPLLLKTLFQHLNPQGRTPMHAALDSSDTILCLMRTHLLEVRKGEEYLGLWLNVVNNWGMTMLHCATAGKYSRLARWLLRDEQIKLSCLDLGACFGQDTYFRLFR